MESKLRETSKVLMKALEGWYPYIKGIEESIYFLEGDIENLTARKTVLSKEIADMIKAGNDILEMDKKKSVKMLGDAEVLLKQAHEIYLELYKAKVSKIVPPPAYGDSLMSKAKTIQEDIKKKQEAVA